MFILNVGKSIFSKMPFYAVARGRIPGIFNTWSECETQIKGFGGAIFKKFGTKTEAQSFIDLKNGLKVKNAPNNGPKTSAIGSNKRTASSLNSTNPKKIKTQTEDDKVIKFSKINDISYEVDDNGFVRVFTDGSCEGNGQPNACAGLGVYFMEGHKLNIAEPVNGRATNNCGEIQAAIKAIKLAQENGVRKLAINTDSQFLINAVTKWMPAWKLRGWKLANGQDVKNKIDFIQLSSLLQSSGVTVKWIYVEAHKGILGNERADALARQGSAMYRENIKSNKNLSWNQDTFQDLVQMAEKDLVSQQGDVSTLFISSGDFQVNNSSLMPTIGNTIGDSAAKDKSKHPRPSPCELARLNPALATHKKEIIESTIKYLIESEDIYAFDPDPKVRFLKYVENREKRHFGVLDRMENELKQVNCELSDKIEMYSQQLQENIHQFKQILELYRITIECNSKEVNYKFDLKTLTDYWDKIQKFEVFNLFERIDKFRCQLSRLDKIRTETSKKIYNSYARKITEVGYLVPLEVEKLFYNIVYKYDKKMLETKLHRDEFCEMIKVNSLSLVAKFKKFLESMKSKRDEAYEEIAKFKATQDERIQKVKQLNDIVHEFLKDIQIYQDNADILVNEFNAARFTLFWRNTGSNQSLIAMNTVPTLTDFDLSPVFLIEIMFSEDYLWSHYQMSEEEFTLIIEPFTDILTISKTRLTTLANFLKTAQKYWLEHEKRVDGIFPKLDQRLLEMQEPILSPNRFKMINEKIDAMRISDSEKQIRDHEAVYNKLFISFQNTHRASFAKQRDLVRNITTAVTTESERMKAVCNQIIEEFPRTKEVRSFSQYSIIDSVYDNQMRKPASDDNMLEEAEEEHSTDSDAEVQFRDMINMSIKVIESWKNGIIESAEVYSTTFENNFIEKTQKYITTKIDEIDVIELEGNKAIKALNEQKLDTSVIRLAEIGFHKQILDRHEAAVKNSITALTNDKHVYTDSLDLFVEDLEIKIDVFLEELSENMNLTGILEIDLNIREYYLKELEVVKTRDEKIISYFSQKFNYIKHTTDVFIQKLKGFNDGGNYSAGELTVYKNKLKLIDAMIQSKEEKLIDTNIEYVLKTTEAIFKDSLKTLATARAEINFKTSVEMVLSSIPEEMARVLKFSRSHLLCLAKRNNNLSNQIMNPRCGEKSSLLRELGHTLNCHIERLQAYAKFFQYHPLFEVKKGSRSQTKIKKSGSVSVRSSGTSNSSISSVNHKTKLFSIKPSHVTIDGNGMLSDQMNIFHAICDILWKKTETIEKFTKSFNKNRADDTIYCITTFYEKIDNTIFNEMRHYIDTILREIDQHCLEFRRQFNKFCFLLNKYTEATIAELHSMLIHDLQQKFKAYINKFEKKKTQSKTDIDEDLPTVFLIGEEQKYTACMEELNQHLKSFIDEIYKPELWEKTAIPKSEYNIIKIDPLPIQFLLNVNKKIFSHNMRQHAADFMKLMESEFE